ncbi:hypothetical protein LCGC14_2766670 [marine sediment metagenome]|uniref:Zinc finger CHC2-type domain-containing protein n=1 Tax=marine sediment metagenome TaxID=412755 RepID=A0A0F8ZJ72_9ZZZZ
MTPRKYIRIGKNYKQKIKLLSFDDAYPALEIVRDGSDGWFLARCPSHFDEHPSLGVKEGDDGELVVNCFFGCSTKEVIDEIRRILK